MAPQIDSPRLAGTYILICRHAAVRAGGTTADNTWYKLGGRWLQAGELNVVDWLSYGETETETETVILGASSGCMHACTVCLSIDETQYTAYSRLMHSQQSTLITTWNIVAADVFVALHATRCIEPA